MSRHKSIISSEIEENIELTQLVHELKEQVAELQAFKNRYEKVVTAGGQSINKMENGEMELVQDIPDHTKMNYDEQVQSVVNTIKILPPNLVFNGRQLIHNVQALNGKFLVTEQHMNDAYNLLPKEAA